MRVSVGPHPVTAPADATAGRPLGHVDGLDGVRGLAVLLVLGLHVGTLVSRKPSGWLPGGLVGVDLFFVLSGFLITSLLLAERARTGRISFGAFYARRACRLLPALAVLVVAYAVYARATGTSVRDMITYLAPIALYVGNWAQSFGVKFPQGIGHTWTLGVEEQFYLVWPAVLMLLLRRSRSRTFIVVVLVAAIAASALVRAWIWRYGGGWPSAYMRTDARADGLLMGALAAFLWRWDALPRRWVQLAASVALGALVVFVPIWDATSPAMFYGGFTIAAFGCAAMVAAVADGAWRATPVFQNSVLRAIGRVSYGLYLWHVFLLTVVSEQLPDWSPAAQAALGLAATAAATAISWRLVEQPFLRLKSRWSRERSVEVVLPAIPATLA